MTGSDGPFGFSEARIVEDGEEGPPSDAEFRISDIEIRADGGIIRKVKKMVVLLIGDGLFATLQ